MSGDPLDALRDERIRESRLTAYGHAILRFSYAQLLPRNRTEFVALLEKFGVPRGPKPRFVDGVPMGHFVEIRNLDTRRRPQRGARIESGIV